MRLAFRDFTRKLIPRFHLGIYSKWRDINMQIYLVYTRNKFVIQVQPRVLGDLPLVVFHAPFGLRLYEKQPEVNLRTPFIEPG